MKVKISNVKKIQAAIDAAEAGLTHKKKRRYGMEEMIIFMENGIIMMKQDGVLTEEPAVELTTEEIEHLDYGGSTLDQCGYDVALGAYVLIREDDPRFEGLVDGL